MEVKTNMRTSLIFTVVGEGWRECIVCVTKGYEGSRRVTKGYEGLRRVTKPDGMLYCAGSVPNSSVVDLF